VTILLYYSQAEVNVFPLTLVAMAMPVVVIAENEMVA
jgi:hypothetical protein